MKPLTKIQEVTLDTHGLVKWKNTPFGMTLILGDTGTGKSVIAKMIMAEVSYNPETKSKRKVIVFDPKGDYADRRGRAEQGIRQLNREAIQDGRYAYCLSCKIIKWWKPTIGDMKDDMWEVFGFPQIAFNRFLKAVHEYKEVHNNDPTALYKFLSDCPETSKEAKNSDINLIIPPASKQSILGRFKPKMFTKTKPIYLPLEIERHNILFTPPSSWKENSRIMRVYYALILKQITKVIMKTSPLLVFDESSRLFPHGDKLTKIEKDNLPAIINWLDDTINVLMRLYSINIILIAQRPSQLHHVVFEEPIDYQISGRIFGDPKLRKLKFDYQSGIRMFEFKDNKVGATLIFEPKKPGCEV